MAFDIDFQERGLIKEHIAKFLLYPHHWNDINNQLSIALTWQNISFEAGSLPIVPNNQKGIYCFVVKPMVTHFFETTYLFYIGKTTRSFRVRFNEYLRDAAGKGKPRTRVFKMLKLNEGYLHFFYADITQNVDIDDCEIKLLNTFVPLVNTDIPKARIKPELKDIYL